MSQLVQRLDFGDRITPLRDSTYLAWRLANPLATYRYVYSGSDELDGFLVLAGEHRARAHILDIEATSPTVLANLVRALFIVAPAINVDVWSTSRTSEFIDTLRSFGFRSAIRGDEADGLFFTRSTRPTDAELQLDGHQLTNVDEWVLRATSSDRY